MRVRLLLASIVALLLAGTLAAPHAGAQDEPVVFWEGTWNTAKINTELAAFILEHGYDRRIQQIDVSTSIMQQSMLEGEIDVNMELWCINREQWCAENLGDQGPLTKLSPIYRDSTQGWYVPRYVIEGSERLGIDPMAPDLRRVGQLDEPRFVQMFEDPANPGQARLISAVSGWAISKANEVKLHAYGLAEEYTAQTVGSQAALDSAIVGAIQQGEPFVAYYWTPTWIMGKYDMVKLDEPEWSEACEAARDEAVSAGPPYDDVPEQAGCAYQTTDIHVGVRSDLAERAPEVVELVDAMDVGLEPIADAAAYMKREGVPAAAAAVRYLRQHPDRWKQWVPDDVAQRVEQALAQQADGGDDATLLGSPSALEVDVSGWVNARVETFTRATGSFFRAASDVLTYVIARVQQLLLWVPWWAVAGAFAALGWFARDWKLAVGIAAGFVALGVLGVWDESMKTLALILFATGVSVAIGVPFGILAARSDRVDTVVRPVLDFMQTMPSFVYLVPAVILFSIGQVPALIATVIYATPPAVRLTNLGIRQVRVDAIEAADAFGATDRQKLWKVQLPLAFPTIMAGVNQTVMLALAMVVIASLVGAEGLGRPVLDGLQNLNIGLAFVGGLGIVILAMIIDRLTQAFGRDEQEAAA